MANGIWLKAAEDIIDQKFEELFEMLRVLIRKKEERTILIKIKFEIYPITTEVLNRVFSACGFLESVEKLSPKDDFHSEVCFQDQDSAMRALDWYNGQCIYDRCCELELFQASQVRDRLSQVGVSNPGIEAITEDSTTQEISRSPSETEISPIESDDIQNSQESPRNAELKVEVLLGKVLGNSGEELINVGNPVEESIQKIDSSPHFVEKFNKPEICFTSSMSPTSWNFEGAKSEVLEVLDHTVVNDLKKQEGIHEEVIIPGSESVELTKVNSFPTIISDYIPAKLGELVVLLIELIEMRLANFSTNSSDGLRITNAHKMFDEMPDGLIHAGMSSTEFLGTPSVHQVLEEVSTNADMVTFDPGGLIISCFTSLRASASNWVRDINARGFSIESQVGKIPNRSAELFWILDVAIVKQKVLIETLVFDPGIAKLGSTLSNLQPRTITCVSCSWKFSSNFSIGRVKTMIMVFDPGGVHLLLRVV